MAITFLFPAANNIFSKMVGAGLLQLFMVVMVIAERCTRAVPVHEFPAKKVHVLRRIPATCSNWDKAWAWLTKVDCGTKYRLDLVTVPQREVKQYKLQYVCCDGDTECKDADNVHAPGFDTTDEKFLAIVLGSAAACVVIIIIIFAVTFYTKKSRCQTICDQESHVYASAEVDEVQDNNGEEKHQPQEVENDKDYKCTDAEYAEICDSRLPRYTDIFKDNVDEKGNPFNKASAPPMYSAVNPKDYINTEVTATAPLQCSDEIQSDPRASSIQTEGTGEVIGGGEKIQRGLTSGHSDEENNDGVLYYNVGEELNKIKHSGSSGDGLNVNKKEVSNIKRDKNTAKAETKTSSGSSNMNLKIGSKKGKQSSPANMEMMVKSSSASETIGKMSETALTKQKRRSAPPGSIDASVGYMYGQQGSLRSATSSSAIRSNSNNTCTVIHETVPVQHRGADKRQKMKSSRENLPQNPVRKISQGSNSSIGGSNFKKSSSQNLCDAKAPRKPTSSSKEGLKASDMASDDSESAPPKETDSLLRSSSCHSGCGDDTAFGGCEHCSKYDRINGREDPDTVSLHIYQCLDEVRKECETLRAASAAAGLKTLGLESSAINNTSSDSIRTHTDQARHLQC